MLDRVNRGGTRDLAAAAAAAPALRRFVLVSSRAATGASRDGRPVSAATPPRPAYDYGVSKLEAERELARVPGLAWCAVRPPLLYGPGDRLTLPLFRLAARGLYPQFAGGLRYLSMVHVTDAARAVRLAGEAPGIEGRAIHLTGPEPVTPAALGDALERAAGRNLHRLRVPAPLVALLAEAMEPLLGRSVLRELDSLRQDADETEALDAIGFRSRVPLVEGVAEAMAAYRREGLVNRSSSPRSSRRRA